MDFDDIQDVGTPQTAGPTPASVHTGSPQQAPVAASAQQDDAPNFDDIQDAGHAMYGTPKEEAKAAVGKFAKGLLGPVATGIQKLYGARDSDITGRETVFGEDHPIASTGLEMAGLATGSLTGAGEGALLEHAGVGAAKAIGLGEPVSAAAKIASSTVKGAVENALYQSGDEVSKMMLSDPDQSVGSALADVGLSGLIGGGISGAIGAVNPLWHATVGSKLDGTLTSVAADATGVPSVSGPKVNPVLKKVLSTFGGVSEKDIDTYAANRAAIKELPESDEIYQHALDHVNSIQSSFENASDNVREAKDAFKDFESNAKQAYREQGFDAREATSKAKQALDNAQEKLATNIQDRALNTAQPIVSSVEQLHQNVLNQSRAALDQLKESGSVVHLNDFFAKGKELAEELRSKAVPELDSQANKIEGYLDHVKGVYGENNVSAPNAKKLIQGLDAVSTYDHNATQFDKGLSRTYKALRYELDDSLKTQLPAYREAMKPLAEDVRLLKSLKSYGDEASAMRKVKGIKSPDKYKTDMPILRQLEERTGNKFTHEIEPYANPEINAKMHEALPEYATHQKAASITQDLKDPRAIAAMQEAIHNSPESQRLLHAQEKLEQAKALKESLNGTTENNLQGKLASAGRGMKAPVATLEKFPAINGKSLPETLELNKTRQAFTKDATHGSRNVNLLGGIGAAVGIAGEHAAGGLGLGATLGGFADKYGPQATQKILDLYLDKFGGIAKMAGASPEASKLAVASMLISGKEPTASSFKAAVDYAQAVIKGNDATTKAAKAVFKAGREVLPSTHLPTDKDRARLDKQLHALQVNPQGLMNVGGKTADYMQMHAQSMASTSTNAVNYLNSLRPSTDRASPLDAKPTVNPVAKAAYNRALDIATQPTIVLNHIKQGTLQPQDVVALKTMYPALYTKFSGELMNHMTITLNKGDAVPYKTRMGISMFTAQPVDSTMTPNNIMAAQMSSQSAGMAHGQGPGVQPGHAKVSQSGMSALSKMDDQYRTQGQNRQLSRESGK